MRLLIGCIFTNNRASYSGGIDWWGANGTLASCTFTRNVALSSTAGALTWGRNGTSIDCIFTGNSANTLGGAVYTNTFPNIFIRCTFVDNAAKQYGGAIYWNGAGFMVNCSFVNSKSQQTNGIYTRSNLNINDGKGIVYVFNNGTLSGASIMVLNNETYYYSPGENINFINHLFFNGR